MSTFEFKSARGKLEDIFVGMVGEMLFLYPVDESEQRLFYSSTKDEIVASFVGADEDDVFGDTKKITKVILGDYFEYCYSRMFGEREEKLISFISHESFDLLAMLREEFDRQIRA